MGCKIAKCWLPIWENYFAGRDDNLIFSGILMLVRADESVSRLSCEAPSVLTCRHHLTTRVKLVE